MKLKVLTFLLVFHASTCYKKAPDELKHSKKPITSGCQEISCPAVEDAVCMKLKNKNSNTTVYVRLINKCEMGYMKCHKDMEGSIVPMKYCDHIHLLTGRQNNSHNRRKRSLIDEKRAVRKAKKKSRSPKSRSKSKKRALRGTDDERADGDADNAPANDAAGDSDAPVDFVISSSEKNKPRTSDAAVESDNEKQGKDEDPSSENEDFLGDTEYDDKFRSDCPSVCPTRIKLVCAKCDHGVYKTFLSSCHVRMFNCRQENEKMELVSRGSCIYSSPLMRTDEESTNIDLVPNGKVYDRDDGDPVLAFIRCRNKNSMLVDEQGLEVIDASACKNIAQEMRKDKDYDNK